MGFLNRLTVDGDQSNVKNYSAGTGITISENGVISATGVGAIDENLSTVSTNPVQNKTVTNAINGKQEKLVAGTGITIQGNVISSTGGVNIDTALSTTSVNPVQNKVITNALNGLEQNVTNLTNEVNNLEGSVTNISNQVTNITQEITDLGDDKQDKLVAGENITIVGNVISATGGGGSVVVDSVLSTTSTNPVQNKVITNTLNGMQASMSTKQDRLTAGTNITIDANNVISATGGSGSLPPGGTTGQALVKKTDITGDVEWKDVGGSITVDDALSNTSTNPVQNKVISSAMTTVYAAINNIQTEVNVIQNTCCGGGGNYVIYSAILDMNNSDPNGAVEYADDALGEVKGWDNWKNKEIFKDLKPCVLKNRNVLYYLNPDNYAKQISGEDADITTLGNDVMVEFPYRVGYSIRWLDSARTKIKVSVTNSPNLYGFNYDAFSLDAENDCDRIYIGAYLSTYSSDLFYSSSGKSINATANSYGDNRYITNRGVGYRPFTFGMLNLIQCLYIIAHGALNSQIAVGMGYVTGNTGITKSGGTNALGFNYELATYQQKTNGKTQVKCLGIEDLWGNTRACVHGVAIKVVANTSMSTPYTYNIVRSQFASQLVGAYVDYGRFDNGTGGAFTLNGFTKLPFFTAGRFSLDAGFLPRDVSGSEGVYFCDQAICSVRTNDYYASVHIGGGYDKGGGAGIFAAEIDSGTSPARIVYMHKEV